MKIKFTEKDISILRIVSQISGGFSLIVALTMIFSFAQLKIMKPLDSPVLLSIKEQYDKDPSNGAKAEQIRAMDLMARKAYFSSRWQVETGSYLLIAGVVIFILCQRIISENEKLNPVISDSKQNSSINRAKNRKYLISTVSVIFILAIASSFLLRAYLPDTSGQISQNVSEAKEEVTIRLPNLIKQTGHFSADRIVVVLQAVLVIRQNGMVNRERILNGNWKYRGEGKVLL